MADENIQIEDRFQPKSFTVDASNTSEGVRLAPPQTEVVENKVEPEKPAKEEDVDPRQAIAELRKQIEDANKAKTDAEEGRKRAEAQAQEAFRRAQTEAKQRQEALDRERRAAAEAARSRTQVDEAQYDSILNGLQAAEQAKAAMQANYAALMAEGKFAEAAQVGADLAEVGARLVSLKDGKAQHEARTKREQPRQETEQRADPPSQDVQTQRETWLSQQHYANAAWIRQHQDRFFSDPEFQNKAIAASGYALNVLKAPIGSVEYYRAIDEAVGLAPKAEKAEPKAEAKPEKVETRSEATSSASQTTGRSSPTPAAAPSRMTPSQGALSSQTWTLTPQQREHARYFFSDKKDEKGNRMDPEYAYAQQLQRDYEKGLCDKNGHYFTNQ